MTGDVRGTQARLLFEHAQRGDARGHNGRLRVGREHECVIRPVEAERGKLKAQDCIGLGKNLGGHRELLG